MIHQFSRNNAKSRSSAFTLIELLVVIAIIAILAAILFPVFARARENARRASCQSNLKQIALGIKQYLQDYDERFPMVWNKADATIGWATIIEPYVKSEQIYQCPSQPNRDVAPNYASAGNVNKYGYSDYFYNSNLGALAYGSSCPDASNTNKFAVKEAEIDYSSNVILLGDGGRGGDHNLANTPPLTSYNTGQDYTSLATPADNTHRPVSNYVPGWFGLDTKTPAGSYAFLDGQYLQKVINTHFEGMNIAFVDGHVKWMKPDKLTFDNPGGSNVTFKVNDTNGGSDGRIGCSNT
jgi:prepilin-type N-terminal cleavage/methylation domain-containing protein/prepilin-type processing-associated H-X9-DG protein